VHALNPASLAAVADALQDLANAVRNLLDDPGDARTEYIQTLPEQLTVSAPTLRAWTRNRLAVRHCRGGCPAANPWDGRCGGHPDQDVQPGHRIVLGRPAAGPRAVYEVVATGTAGTRLERIA
jgi:hypothetical protein